MWIYTTEKSYFRHWDFFKFTGTLTNIQFVAHKSWMHFVILPLADLGYFKNGYFVKLLIFHFNIFHFPSLIIFFFRILQDSMASTYEDMGPVPWYRTEQAIFYIVFFIVFPFFFVNIFVALIIVTFNELGEAELEDDMDKNQKSCIDFAIQAKPMQLYVPSETSGIR